jgi:hypothetical protein
MMSGIQCLPQAYGERAAFTLELLCYVFSADDRAG